MIVDLVFRGADGSPLAGRSPLVGEPLTSPSDLRPRVFFGSSPLSDYLLFAQQQYSYLNIYLFYSPTLSDVDSVPEMESHEQACEPFLVTGNR